MDCIPRYIVSDAGVNLFDEARLDKVLCMTGASKNMVSEDNKIVFYSLLWVIHDPRMVNLA